MQFHQLAGFVRIVDAGSFTLAAEQLRITQSALSHAIASLEKELQVTLLQRDRQGARPTEAGERLLPHVREILARLERIRHEARNTTGLLSGRVRIGSIPSATVDFLPRAIAAFSRQHPNIDLVMLEEPSQGHGRLLDWLTSHTIDLALIELPLAEFDTVPLMDDELCAVLPADSPLAELEAVPMQELVGLPFVLSRYSSEPLIHQAFQGAGEMPDIRFEVQDLGTLISLVREGLGISLVPRLALPKTPEGLALRSVSPRIERRLGFLVRSLEGAAPAVQAFMQSAQKLLL
ncbi:LysR family transcriptional regulator [Deinococcus cellulosilyticus]|uniref:Putative HTH-type transcriptional regulator YvbU n=1 Tax=Deinococcus cellulosilyticus (strain DSM 18568 / NBRC 106333 / KACC 11606 / 5516J-15) TaxID=1223518 RepID=A0A511MYH7_DEIC1|nr:LysR family transcriptional regulator [Deinococcus cellulosilyticus]GEM45654.1 putative HTH-type transcriptional regulator YvbU [Deinococcus cellulosilyticus NBRC 106333 = KACC 11606]